MFRTSPETNGKQYNLGSNKYVLRYGVLGWGVPTAILYSLLMGYMEGWDKFPFILPLVLIAFPLGGILFGRFCWRTIAKRQEQVED